jgi:hypothetical protein
MLDGRKFKEGNNRKRIDLVILLYLSYLTMLLSDFVIDSVHYQSVSNQFMYGTLFLVSITGFSILIAILVSIRLLFRKMIRARRIKKLRIQAAEKRAFIIE